MGGFAPQAIMTVIGLGLNAIQTQRQAKAGRAQVETEAAANAADVETQRAAAEREREERLRRALATQRARFAAQGLDPAQGSAAAVLGGLVAEAEREAEEDREQVNSRLGLLDRRRRRQLDLLSASGERAALNIFRRALPSRSLLDF
ncbi:MAG: hypothetical protein AAB223_00265 [Pseudomonadota bacterium]